MIVAGKGEYQPLADNATADGRNRNRRVTLVILDTIPEEAPPTPADAPAGPMTPWPPRRPSAGGSP